MKGVIIFPTYLKKFFEWPSAHIYFAIRDYYGFELKYEDKIDIDANTDVVIMFGMPYHNRPDIVPGFSDLSKKTKLIMFVGDVHCYDNKDCLRNKITVFDRCDLIVSQSYTHFAEVYPQFLSKFKFLPEFFTPHERYTQLPFNENPKLRCLLSGSVSHAYPLRSFVKENKTSEIDYRNRKYAAGDNYAKLLHSYFCCITCSSMFKYILSKHLEIPATGSLLLTDETEDLKRIGFVPYQHYIPVTKKDVLTKIHECLKKPNDYNKIRKEGMEFVRKNHSLNNRIEAFKEIFNTFMNGK